MPTSKNRALELPNSIYVGKAKKLLSEGYKFEEYKFRGISMPRIVAATHQHKLIPVFQSLIDSMRADFFDVVLERSDKDGRSIQHRRDCIESVVIHSFIEEHRQRILCDGNLSVVVTLECRNISGLKEVRLDEHKYLVTHGNGHAFENTLHASQIYERSKMHIVNDFDHAHLSYSEAELHFFEMVKQIGAFDDGENGFFDDTQSFA